ncbi:MAG: S8 family serine peptidase [Flavobacteriaceae bacterium]|nr:S8 family serine peptidase [Flavobacteriaceae bacterium]
MIKITKLLSLFLFAISANLLAQKQEAEFVQGEVLISIDDSFDKYNIKNLINDTPSVTIIDSKKLSKTLNIYQIKFESTDTVDEQFVINEFLRNKHIKYAQKNHIVKHRGYFNSTSTLPNDPLIGSQWQYYQTSDADIDADLAWDITTGGTTANGHTIVAESVDVGYQLDHPDMDGNYWVNEAEIPDNGVDDDGNGFIDDVNGWYPSSDSDDLPNDLPPYGPHGTAVAGIMGAKGNNGTGVSGVNWNAKIMATSYIGAGGTEANAVEAYDYALQNRLKFNQTNGAEGAFVVVTNSSFGVDNGNPDNFPLWCNMFDSLGNAGILSCGATINANEDVDVIGDVPTACPSDYLISVTNTDSQDNKFQQAGYGAQTIDLGAPGQNTYTITSSSGYGSFGGTSGATPHVAGSVALLYSAPYEAFAEMAINDPSGTALKVKQYILDGVDPNPSLDGKTVSGGRLNVFNSLQLLKAEFEEMSVEENAFSSAISIYPNPANTTLNIKMKNGVNWEKISIYSIEGKLVKKLSNEGQSSIDISKLQTGTYLVQILSEDGQKVHNERLVKQ